MKVLTNRWAVGSAKVSPLQLFSFVGLDCDAYGFYLLLRISLPPLGSHLNVSASIVLY